MKSVYFNNWECNHAFNLINTNPKEAEICYREYLKKYPKDYRAYPYYAYTLTIQKKFSDALKIIDYSQKKFESDTRYQKDTYKALLSRRNFIISRLRVLAGMDKYEEFYNYYNQNKNLLTQDNFIAAIMYCKKQLGMLDNRENDFKSYFYRQLMDYQESTFKDHIKGHLLIDEEEPFIDEDKEEKTKVPCYFQEDFPIEEVIEEIKKYIPSSKGLAFGYFDDKYIFKYERCGRSNNRIQDYFTVVVFRKDGNMITMYPSNNCEELPHIDLSYLKEKHESKKKIKVKSQTEKFRQRYGL